MEYGGKLCQNRDELHHRAARVSMSKVSSSSEVSQRRGSLGPMIWSRNLSSPALETCLRSLMHQSPASSFRTAEALADILGGHILLGTNATMASVPGHSATKGTKCSVDCPPAYHQAKELLWQVETSPQCRPRTLSSNKLQARPRLSPVKVKGSKRHIARHCIRTWLKSSLAQFSGSTATPSASSPAWSHRSPATQYSVKHTAKQRLCRRQREQSEALERVGPRGASVGLCSVRILCTTPQTVAVRTQWATAADSNTWTKTHPPLEACPSENPQWRARRARMK